MVCDHRFDVAEVSHFLDDKSGIDALKKRITLDNFDPYEASSHMHKCDHLIIYLSENIIVCATDSEY